MVAILNANVVVRVLQYAIIAVAVMNFAIVPSLRAIKIRCHRQK